MTKRIAAVVVVLSLLFSLSVVSVSAADVTAFQDVPNSHWAHGAIMDMVKRGMFQGTSPAVNGVGAFSPNDIMSRAQFITVLTRLLYPEELAARPNEGGDWYAPNYAVALEQGLLSPTEFEGGQLTRDCSRQEMAMLLVRAAEKYNSETAYELIPVSRIADYDKIDSYYRDSVQRAYSMGLLTGVDNLGTFDPNGVLRRDQGATVIYRLIEPKTRNVVRFNEICDFTWEDGTTYAGEYKNGEADGYGVMTFPSIGTYEGYFSRGKRNGLGTFSWDVGDRYIGNWANDAMSGAGTYTFSDGYSIRGNWNKNRIAASDMRMNYAELSLPMGAKTDLAALCTPLQTTDTILWSCSDPAVVEISGKSNVCRLSAKATGTAIVTARSLSGKSCACTVTVSPAVETVSQISLSYGDYQMTPGETVMLQASILPAGTSSAVRWTSSDPSVATVGSLGEVTAISSGTAIISATTENDLTATCYIVVDSPFADMWNGTWSVYPADAAGNADYSSSNGTCIIDTGSMQARLSAYPYSNSAVSLSKNADYQLSGKFETSLYTYELTFTSVNDNQIILEENQVYLSSSGLESVTTEYYALFH